MDNNFCYPTTKKIRMKCLEVTYIRKFLGYIDLFLYYIFQNRAVFFRLFVYLYRAKIKGLIIISPKHFGHYKIILDPNSGIDRTIFLRGIAHPDVVDFMLRRLNRDSVFFDIGSHSGYFSILASLIIREGQIHAFEPLLNLYINTLSSIKEDNIKNIILNNLCVGDKNGQTKFYTSELSDTSSIKRTKYQSKVRTMSCKMVRLDTYCRRNRIKKISMMKIDVEGGERDILLSSEKIIKKFKPIMIIEFTNKTAEAFDYHPNEMYDLLGRYGYHLCKYSHITGKLDALEKKDYYEENVYCIPKKKLNKRHRLIIT